MSRFRVIAMLACTALLALSSQARAGSSDDRSFAAGARAAANDAGAWHLDGLDKGDHQVWDGGHGGLGGHDDDHFGHVSPVPEPGSWALMAGGLPLVAWVAARRNKRKTQDKRRS